MTKLLELTTEDGFAALINLDNVTKMVDGEDDELTTVYFTGGDELEVKERVKAIVEKAR
ncbi:MAG: hypothetical protein ACM31O_02210 [Bacteroidota bacterium]|jgi:hypothetical protein